MVNKLGTVEVKIIEEEDHTRKLEKAHIMVKETKIVIINTLPSYFLID